MRRLALLLALAALAAPVAAQAHATLVSTFPAVGQRLETAPRAVELRFGNPVRVLRGSIQVQNADGVVVSLPAVQKGDLVLRAALPRIAKGPYTVRWRALSANDGHVVAGVYTFGVRYPAPPATAAFGATGPGATEHVVRWGYFAALALLVGGLGFWLIVLRGRAPAAVARRLYWLTGIGVVGVIELGIAAFMLRADAVLQVPFAEFLYGDLSPLSDHTRFGKAFIAMTLGFAFVAALLFLAWLTDRPRALLWPAFAISLLFASGLALSSHAAEAPSATVAEALDYVHLAAATLWLGGLLALGVAVWPLAPELRREAFLRFSRLATVCVAALVGAGIYLSVERLPRASDLWTQGYGRVLLVKLALVSLALAWGGFHNVVGRPLVQRAGDGTVGRIGRSLLGEGAVGVAVLLVAAILVDAKPPAKAPTPAQAAPARTVAR